MKMLVVDLQTSPDAKGAVTGVHVAHVSGDGAKFSGICECNGKIIAAPCDSFKILVYDTGVNKCFGIDIASVAQGGMKWAGICSSHGRVYMAPADAPKLLVFEPPPSLEGEEGEKYNGKHYGLDVSKLVEGEWKCSDICEMGDKLYMASCNSSKMLIFDQTAHKLGCTDIPSEVASGNGKFSGVCVVNKSELYFAPRDVASLVCMDSSSGAAAHIEWSSAKRPSMLGLG